MPDAARKWLEDMAPYYDDDEAQVCHLRRLLAENATLQKQVEGLETEIYREMQGRRLLDERHAATGHLLRDFNDNYKKIKDKYANLQKTLDGMDDGELLKDYRNWKAIREAEGGE